MEHLSIALRALFSKQKSDDILASMGFLESNKSGTKHLDSELTESQITNLLLKEETRNYSIDQLSMTGQLVLSKWMMPDNNCLPMKFNEKDSVFNVLLYFAISTLKIEDGDPVCRYESLLRWHTLTSQMGEDIFTTAYLASRNIAAKYKRKYFDWPAFVKHDCKEVNAIFERPMADLHMHLKGSSYNFDISWIYLMNHIDDINNMFTKVAESRKDTGWDDKLSDRVRRAAAIRFYLANAVGCISSSLFSKVDLYGVLTVEHTRKSVQELIDCQKENAIARCVNNSEIKRFIIDYIPVEHYSNECVENLVMASERSLLYNAFYYIYDNPSDPDIASLLYAYLTCKDEFRHTILQLNGRVGFANFANYEELKVAFVDESCDPLLYKAAIEGFTQKCNNRYVEARIVPKDSPEMIQKSIEDIYEPLSHSHNKEDNSKCNIVFHFIKKRDNSYSTEKEIRHNELRAEVKKKAFAIFEFRQNSTAKNNMVGHVVGIDAANSEIYTRPEVFGQAFRFLRGHELFSSEKDHPNDLRVTFHVGEDFLDLADGLRAVEEAMIFLDLRTGDRLGHALALGTDVRAYYNKRYDTICETKQVILDNLAWLHHKCNKLLGGSALSDYLETMFHKYFREVFIDSSSTKSFAELVFLSEDSEINDCDDIKAYYLSWLLRGNAPKFGNDLASLDNGEISSDIEQLWIKASINHRNGPEMACRNSMALTLFDMYHSKKSAKWSNAVDSFTVPAQYRDDYYTLLEKIQEDLLAKIERRHIAIECNPSSNYKIGEIDRYDQHPIVKFYNYGLSTSYPQHNISVSINTDDQGVFSTSLEREYSLMALAMERHQEQGFSNSSRAIVDWLDNIRKMSIEQKF